MSREAANALIAKFTPAAAEHVEHLDRYYELPGTTNTSDARSSIWVSLRSREKDSINVKKFYFDYSNEPTYCDEYDLAIESTQKMAEILTVLGFRESVVVRKRRHSFAEAEWTLAVDEVYEIGFFAEIELDISFDSNAEAESCLQLAAESLGLSESARVLDGYPTLIIEARNQAASAHL